MFSLHSIFAKKLTLKQYLSEIFSSLGNKNGHIRRLFTKYLYCHKKVFRVKTNR